MTDWLVAVPVAVFLLGLWHAWPHKEKPMRSHDHSCLECGSIWECTKRVPEICAGGGADTCEDCAGRDRCPNCGLPSDFEEHEVASVETHGLDCGPYEQSSEMYLICKRCSCKTDHEEVARANTAIRNRA